MIVEFAKLFPEEQLQAFDALLHKKFHRIDPVTKKPHSSNKECFWEVEDVIPYNESGGSMNSPMAMVRVQRYWLNKKYKAQVGPNGPVEERHLAWNQMNDKGELEVPGVVMRDYTEFLKEFVAV